MDPVVASVVSALSAGALAIGKGFANEAIKDSYKALRNFLLARFAHAAPFVEVVDKKPSETTADLLAEQIAPVAGDAEAETLANTLRTAIEAFRNEPQADAVLRLLRSKTGDIEVDTTESSRPLADFEDSETGKISIRGSTFTGGSKNTDDSKKKA